MDRRTRIGMPRNATDANPLASGSARGPMHNLRLGLNGLSHRFSGASATCKLPTSTLHASLSCWRIARGQEDAHLEYH